MPKSKANKKPGVFETPELRNPSKTLLANIRFASIDEPIKTIVVTSSSPNEGKTATSTNLACAIASAGNTVLLVDADMRKRCIANMLNEHPRYGIRAVLSGETTPEEAIIRTKYEYLDFLNSESNIPSPPDILSTQKFKNLVASLRDAYDYVIFDTPPLGPFVDAAIVASVCDGTVLCVREHKTKREMLVDSVAQLRAANARILGTVLTFAPESNNDYYYAYYSQDGKRVKNSDKHEGRDLPMRESGVGPTVKIRPIDDERTKDSNNGSGSHMAGANNNPYPTKTFSRIHTNR